METRLPYPLAIVGFLGCIGSVIPLRAQCSLGVNSISLSTPAVSGYEQELAGEIRNTIKNLSPKTDTLGNVYVTLGSGTPHRLIVAPIDEPGYVVSEITPDGYLRVQRLPQRAPNAVFDLLHCAQPVLVVTRAGKKIPGVFTGLSVHLQPARQNAPTMSHPDEMYVDIGATSAAEVRAGGVDLLDPIALERFTQNLGTDEVAGPAIGDRFGCSISIDLLRRLEGHKANVSGTLTVAFATQQWAGGRGLDRLLNELHPDELIYIGRLTPPHPDASKATAPPAYETTKLGSGVLVATSDSSAPLSGLAAELKQIGDEHHVAIHAVMAALPAMAGYAKPQPLPNRFVHLGVPTLFSVTPAETISIEDVSALESVLYQYLRKQGVRGGIIGGEGGGTFASRPSALPGLTETYGASGHEEAVREQVKKLLPSWAKPETDAAGNLVLKMGSAKANSNAKKIVFIAHLDEIGYQVRSIEPDGRLLMDVLGGGYTEYFLGHVMLLHKADGSTVGGVLELPAKMGPAGVRMAARAESHGRTCAHVRRHAFGGRNAEVGN